MKKLALTCLWALAFGLATPALSLADYSKAAYEVDPYQLTFKIPGNTCAPSTGNWPTAKAKVARGETVFHYYNWICNNNSGDEYRFMIVYRVTGSNGGYGGSSTTTVPAKITISPFSYIYRNEKYCGSNSTTFTRKTPKYAYQNQFVMKRSISACNAKATFKWRETMRRTDWQ